ncbi:glycosyltransferase [Morganella morganii]|uniref:glycosyltransferase n=1 Tax=Morganella morganii TaxID=582 RepID=UPI0030AD92C0
MKKILLITDICLSDKYNAGNKNGFISLCAYLKNNKKNKVDILNFHQKKPSNILRKDYNIYHHPDYYNLIYRKITNFIGIKKSLLEYKNSSFRKKITSQILKNNYDIVIIEYLENHHLLNICRKYSQTIICDLHDLMFLRKESFKKSGIHPKNENLLIDAEDEINCIAKFDAVITVENSEQELLKKQKLQTKILLCKRIPYNNENNQILTPDINKFLSIGFIGSAAEFNYHTIHDFIVNVWNPELHKKNHKLIIAGTVCDALYKNNIKIMGNHIVLGKVTDVIDFYSLIHLSINPVWSGSGFKTKNAESLSYGVPIITSPNGIKGLEIINTRYCKVIADNNLGAWEAVVSNIKEEYIKNINFKALCKTDFDYHLNSDSCFNELSEYLE